MNTRWVMTPEWREARFWESIKRTVDSCWEWQKGVNWLGYGKITWNKKSTSAHRVAYFYANGPIPEDMNVCHACDNPACCRPSHLFLGTQKDNLQDMVSKGRHRCQVKEYAESNSRHKLSDAQILSIWSLLDAKVSQRKIAKAFGVHQTCISHIRCGILRKKLTDGQLTSEHRRALQFIP